jgi:hypothetical protein
MTATSWTIDKPPNFHKCRNCGNFVKHVKWGHVEHGPRGSYSIALCYDCFDQADMPPDFDEEPLELVEEAAIVAWTPPPQPLPQVSWGTVGRLALIVPSVSIVLVAALAFAVHLHEASGPSGVQQATKGDRLPPRESVAEAPAPKPLTGNIMPSGGY